MKLDEKKRIRELIRKGVVKKDDIKIYRAVLADFSVCQKKLDELIDKDKSFGEIMDVFKGYNYENDLFDFERDYFTGTIIYDVEKDAILIQPSAEIYNADGSMIDTFSLGEIQLIIAELAETENSKKLKQLNILKEAALIEYSNYLDNLDMNEVNSILLSESNYRSRREMNFADESGVWVRVGDICFTDFGKAYKYESGYQHFCLILKIVNDKALVIPMTSNQNTYIKARNISFDGSENLFALPKIKGLNKLSALFLNDAKFINTARIIDVKAHINPHSELFNKIRKAYINIVL